MRNTECDMPLADFDCECGCQVIDTLKHVVICPECGKQMIKRVSCHAKTAERWKVDAK